MVENKLKVLITTSGLGTRLGNLTKYINKSLVKLGDKAIISHIIDTYPEADFVVTLGHFGDQVKQFLELAYPDRNFEFVYVNPYQGEGSGLVKSMSFAKDKLQCPFIFHACDTILNEMPPYPNNNWMACVESQQPDVFRTICVNGNNVTKINEKGEINYDYAYIGVAGIYNYELFWETLDDVLINQPTDSSDCHVLQKMLMNVFVRYWKVSSWYDTGSVQNLSNAKHNYHQNYDVLDKPEESIYFFNDSVIKFFNNKEISSNRVKRAEILSGLVPKIIDYSDNFYKYELFNGELLANSITEKKLIRLIDWARDKLWKPVDVNVVDFKKKCEDFYISKTKARVKQFLNDNSIEDKPKIINEVEVPSCETMFNMIDWNLICSTKPVHFHGDFILDNILYTEDKFMLLDWRQDFAGDMLAGDMYYDLSKLNHNLILNHHMLLNNYFIINISNGIIFCDVFRSHNMVQCQEAFFNILEKRNYDIKKIKILTAIIWLNMSPLHTYPLNNFLFYFGKYNLWKELQRKE